uniref:Protein phosphatase methylesterase 1 n=1 Tax=Timema californicum TaxID=61474 RepID=A0A7R9IZ30_TIMCA|nr:unnamed protein product [Timema californicum]
MSLLEKSILKAKLPPIGPLSARSVRRGLGGRKRDYTPVAWSHYFTERQDVKVNDVDTFRVYKAGTTGPLLVLLHGGGFSALTWSLFSVSVTSMVECRILAIDLRGHGDTITSNEKDLSAKTMAGDVAAVLQKLYDVDPPPIILIGHSMGGAIAVHTACSNSVPSLIGLAVIDVVEGTAIDALNSMQSFLRSRPTHFKSLEHAIEWCVRSAQDASELNMHKYTWRINLGQTEEHWRGWFTGLSNEFLNCQVPKMLLLAGIDRLDKDLTVGQMQGKFQMQVLPQCGHAVHEDVPEKVAEVVATFLVRHKFTEPAANFERTFPAC